MGAGGAGGAGGTTGGGATAANCAWAGNAATTPSIGPTTKQRKTTRASQRPLRDLPARKGRHGQRMWSNSRNRRPLAKMRKKTKRQVARFALVWPAASIGWERGHWPNKPHCASRATACAPESGEPELLRGRRDQHAQCGTIRDLAGIAFEADLALGQQPQRLRIDSVLDAENALRQRLRAVVVAHPHRALHHDRP